MYLPIVNFGNTISFPLSLSHTQNNIVLDKNELSTQFLCAVLSQGQPNDGSTLQCFPWQGISREELFMDDLPRSLFLHNYSLVHLQFYLIRLKSLAMRVAAPEDTSYARDYMLLRE